MLRSPSGRPAVFGALVGLAAAAALTPMLASGDARSTSGANAAAESAINSPMVANLTGAAEVPGPGDTDGSGAASITIDAVTTEVCFDLRVSGIDTATAAHIHSGAAGASGGVLITLAAPTPTSSGCVLGSAQVPPVTTAQLEAVIANPSQFYVNVHNAAFPNGAVRGQLAKTPSITGETQILNEPVRAYDSRTVTDGLLLAGTTRTVSLANGLMANGTMGIAVPPGATAAIVKLTVTDAVGAGFLKMYSAALTTPPQTASVNWYQSGAIVGETGPVAVDAQGNVKITSGVNNTHFVIDVIGYIF